MSNEELSVCFLCLRSKASNKSGTKTRAAASTKFNIKNFLNFAENYLEIPTRDLQIGLCSNDTVCSDCRKILESICDVYEELCSIQENLAAELNHLANLLTETVTLQPINRDEPTRFHEVERVRNQLAHQSRLHGTRVKIEGRTHVTSSKNVNDATPEASASKIKFESCEDSSIKHPETNFDEPTEEFTDEGDHGNESEGCDSSGESLPETGESIITMYALDNTCPQCQKSYQSWTSLYHHAVKIHGVRLRKRRQLKDLPYKCDQCSNSYTMKGALKTHKKRKHDFVPPEKPFSCELCGIKCKTSYALQLHMRRKHGVGMSLQRKDYELPFDQKPHSCKVCGKAFLVKYNLEKHLSQAHRESMFVCGKCSQEFGTRRQLQHHMYTVHKKDKKGLSFLNRLENVKEAAAGDDETLIDECEVCGVNFTSWHALWKHLSGHEQATAEKSHKCYFCSESFTYAQSLKAHLKASQYHDLTEVDRFSCDDPDHLGYSQWIFKSPTELENHFNEEHRQCSILRCVDCGLPFLDKDMMQLHKLVHIPKNQNKKHECPNCPKTFKKEESLQTHYNMAHGVNLKLFRCSICNLGLTTRSGLTNHLQRHEKCSSVSVSNDDNGNRFRCVECSKTYPTAVQLKAHKKNLHETKQCETCGLVIQNSKMSYHMRTVHDRGLHLCSLCGKMFKIYDRLKDHLATKHGEGPYACEICGKRHGSAVYLQRHLTKQHSDLT